MYVRELNRAEPISAMQCLADQPQLTFLDSALRHEQLGRYPHHDEVIIGEGLLTLHRIADKKDSRPAIATIALSDPKSVGMRLESFC